MLGALTEPYHATALMANLKRLHIEPRRVVLEVLEQSAEDIERLALAVQQFRDQGFLIALDDFGAGHTNIERIWQLDPDIVKLDRVMLSHAGHNVHAPLSERTRKQRRNMEAVLWGIVSLLHEAGKLVLIEGVETEHEAQLALASGADFVQGFFFARPHPGAADGVHAQTVIGELTERYRLQTEARFLPLIDAMRHACASSLLFTSPRPQESPSDSIAPFIASTDALTASPVAASMPTHAARSRSLRLTIAIFATFT